MDCLYPSKDCKHQEEKAQLSQNKTCLRRLACEDWPAKTGLLRLAAEQGRGSVLGKESGLVVSPPFDLGWNFRRQHTQQWCPGGSRRGGCRSMLRGCSEGGPHHAPCRRSKHILRVLFYGRLLLPLRLGLGDAGELQIRVREKRREEAFGHINKVPRRPRPTPI